MPMICEVLHGSCLDVLPRYDRVFHAVVTDPPYELGFMGRAWDGSGVSFDVETWRKALAALRPGGHLVAFGGSRTFHRIACAIEDAGFEIRDVLCWLYGTGFPKSLDVSAAIDKTRQDDVRSVCRFLRAAMDARGFSSTYLSNLFAFHPRMIDHWAARDTDSQPTVPTWEQWEKLRGEIGFGPEMDAEVLRLNERKGTPGEAWLSRPIIGRHQKSSPGNLLRVGMLGDEQDPVGPITAPVSDAARQWKGWGTALKPGWEPIILARRPLEGTVAQNVQRWGTGGLNVDGCRLGTGEKLVRPPIKRTETMSSFRKGLGLGRQTEPPGRWPPNVALDEHAANLLDEQAGPRASGAMRAGTHAGRKSAVYQPDAGRPLAADITASTGGASRFFYCAKAPRSERDRGCEDLPPRTGGEATLREDDSPGTRSPRAGAGRTGGARNHHPTVKPVDLMRWLVRLVTPPGGHVLDPFTGSGSTGVACALEGVPFTGIEQEAEYVEIARRRLAYHQQETTVQAPDHEEQLIQAAQKWALNPYADLEKLAAALTERKAPSGQLLSKLLKEAREMAAAYLVAAPLARETEEAKEALEEAEENLKEVKEELEEAKKECATREATITEKDDALTEAYADRDGMIARFERLRTPADRVRLGLAGNRLAGLCTALAAKGSPLAVDLDALLSGATSLIAVLDQA